MNKLNSPPRKFAIILLDVRGYTEFFNYTFVFIVNKGNNDFLQFLTDFD